MRSWKICYRWVLWIKLARALSYAVKATQSMGSVFSELFFFPLTSVCHRSNHKSVSKVTFHSFYYSVGLCLVKYLLDYFSVSVHFKDPPNQRNWILGLTISQPHFCEIYSEVSHIFMLLQLFSLLNVIF